MGRGAAEQSADKSADKSASIAKVVPAKPTVRGSLDKEIIRRVVRKHRREIKYCYEQQLQKDENLAGKVTVKFTISATGKVVAATISRSTLNNTKVERCLTGKIKRWVFPKPEGGGIVIVTYPFDFSAS